MVKSKDIDKNLSPEEHMHKVRESFSGRLLTDHLFKDFVAIVHIVDRQIHFDGSFVDKLGDFAYATARSERFDAMKADDIVRDLYYAIFGKSMNQVRVSLTERAEKLTDDDKRPALGFAEGIVPILKQGNKITFNRAVAAQSALYAEDLGVTHVKARSLMADAFQTAHGKSFYDWGKELDQTYYRAQVDAEKAERRMIEDEGPSQRSRSQGRSGPSL